MPTLSERIANVRWYHSLDLGEAGLTDGVYDHRKYVPYYGFPGDLRGKEVLDVGAGDGFFSFLFEERGAKVTAVNPPSWAAEDYLPMHAGAWSKENEGCHAEDPFSLAREVLGSSAKLLRLNIYDLSPTTVGTFDLVFCGSVLCHLMNPLLGLIRLRSITRELAVIATIVDDSPAVRGAPYVRFLGPGYVHTFWAPTVSCMLELALAGGFRKVDHVSTFRLEGRFDPTEGGLHAVIHAHV